MGTNKLTIKDVPLDNSIVLLRTDYNVPLFDNGEISVQNQFEKKMRELDEFELEIDKSILETNLIMRSLLAKYFA